MTQRSDDEIRRELEIETGEMDERWRPFVGTVALGLATVLGFVSAISGPEPAPWNSPLARGYGLLAALLLAVFAVILLRQPRLARDPRWQPQWPGIRFDSVELYTRSACHLCHQARETLLLHHEFFAEISEILIDGDPDLIARYGESVPVVVIDGRERFRGQIDVLLLRRLIDATTPKATK